MLTIDASVWVNADSPTEENYASSRALLDWVANRQTPVVAPTLLLVEVTAAISRVRGNSALARDYAARMAVLPFIRWIALDEPLAAQAAELAAQHALRGADAVYVAVAMSI
jgi:predicted nucleic acid-binding protein